MVIIQSQLNVIIWNFIKKKAYLYEKYLDIPINEALKTCLAFLTFIEIIKNLQPVNCRNKNE